MSKTAMIQSAYRTSPKERSGRHLQGLKTKGDNPPSPVNLATFCLLGLGCRSLAASVLRCPSTPQIDNYTSIMIY
ncbi:hypothetical protein [Candidatus Magnetominusculus dajiuhuensis]|uniref:hypothetical protein n=1 Tax=Candidatus Magnetominusculus dajiuhuensis TaxID=3137712 RepID=UPI003B42EF80